MEAPDRRSLGPKDWLGLVGFLLLSFGAGAAGVWTLEGDAQGFYRSLPLPGFAPEPAVFRPVWIVTYLLIGVAAWLVWRRWGWSGSGGALNLWVLQLLLNAAWVAVFFRMRDVLLALIVMVLLLLAVIATITAFRRRSALAAWLLVPYGLLVAYATLLNGVVWWSQS